MSVTASARFATTKPAFSPDDSGSGAAVSTPRILIVEDDFLVAGELEHALHSAGFEVVGIAISGSEALDLARTKQPVLAVMDVRLVGAQDGVDTAIALFQTHGIRSIFATAHYDPNTVARAKKAEPLGWLQKPYAIGSLISAIKTALSAS